MMHFPLCFSRLRFDSKQVRISGLTGGFQGRDLRQQLLLSLLRDHDLLCSYLVALTHLMEPLAALCGQSVAMSQALFSGRPSLNQFPVHHWLFRIAVLRLQDSAG